MRINKVVLAAAALAVLAGCGASQPRIYMISMDGSPLASLPPSCYLNNTVSTLREIGTNLREELQWVLWDGVENKQYLDIGPFSVRLGQADQISVGSMIEGSDKVFSGQLVEQKLPDPNSQYTYTKTLSVIVSFNDLGASPVGSVDLSSQYTCTACTNNDNKVNCAAKLNFVGRRVDGTNYIGFSPRGQ